ncbi:MAG: hypothetical protein V4639_04565 [Pseudomonadota bacterium]
MPSKSECIQKVVKLLADLEAGDLGTREQEKISGLCEARATPSYIAIEIRIDVRIRKVRSLLLVQGIGDEAVIYKATQLALAGMDPMTAISEAMAAASLPAIVPASVIGTPTVDPSV